jgi:hypothetical protein
VSFTAITLCVASQRVFVVVVYFVIDSVRKLLDTPSHLTFCVLLLQPCGTSGQVSIPSRSVPFAFLIGITRTPLGPNPGSSPCLNVGMSVKMCCAV